MNHHTLKELPYPYCLEENNCTVKALDVIATYCHGFRSVENVHRALHESGRQWGKGIHLENHLKNVARRLGLRYRKALKPFTTYYLGRFVDDHQNGLYLLRISGHVFAMLDGVIYDTVEHGRNCVVTNAWKFYV